MTEPNVGAKCDICGQDKKTKSVDAYQACSSCRTVLACVKNHPDIIKQLWRTYQDDPILIRKAANVINSENELPEVLDGKRYRTVDRECNKWYLSVSEVEGKPVEIFASTAFDRDHLLQSRISNLTTITRLISMILRHVFLGEPLTLNKCLKQIQRSSRQKNDLPDMLYRVLNRYNEPEQEVNKKA